MSVNAPKYPAEQPRLRPECWLGDVVRAVAWFEKRGHHLTAGDFRAISGMLGFATERPATYLRPDVQGGAREGETANGPPQRPGGTREQQYTTGPPCRESGQDDNVGLTAVPASTLFRLRPPVERRSGGASPLPPLLLPAERLVEVDIGRTGNPRPYAPLLAPQSSRATLQTALQRRLADGAPDVHRLVDLVARRVLFPAELPRTMVPTLRYGAQVLCDRAEPMDPFRRDQAELVSQLRTLLGTERTDEQWFEGSPLDGCRAGANGVWKDYQLPDPGRPVLVLSSFGLGLGPSYFGIRRDWGALSGTLRQRDCAVIALVPAPSTRWPQWLLRLMPVICWDRSTTAGSVAAAVRRVL